MNVTVYGTPVCPNCKTVKSFLESSKVGYDYRSVGEDVTKEQLEETVGRPVRSVPVIVVDGEEVTFDLLKRNIMKSIL